MKLIIRGNVQDIALFAFHFIDLSKTNSFMLARRQESQVDMKEAKRMTLFIIMINVSRNGINAIMKNDPIKYLLKTRRTCGLH